MQLQCMFRHSSNRATVLGYSTITWFILVLTVLVGNDSNRHDSSITQTSSRKFIAGDFSLDPLPRSME